MTLKYFDGGSTFGMLLRLLRKIYLRIILNRLINSLILYKKSIKYFFSFQEYIYFFI